MLRLFTDLDSYAVWKAVAVILTGFFTILGFTTETKNKTNGCLTVWGWISIVGAVVAAGGGVITQIHDNSDDKARRDAQDSSTKAILAQLDANLKKNTDTLEEVQRASTVLQRIRLGATFSLPLGDPLTKAYAEDLKAREMDLEETVSNDFDPADETTGLRAVTRTGPSLSLYLIRPDSSAFPTHFSDKALARALSDLQICLAATIEAFNPKDFESGRFSFYHMRPYKDLDVCLPHREFNQVIRTPGQDHDLPLSLASTEITQWVATGRIISAKDLAAATIIIHSPLGYYDNSEKYWNILSLEALSITINQSPYTITPNNGLKTATDKQGLKVYFFQLPSAPE